MRGGRERGKRKISSGKREKRSLKEKGQPSHLGGERRRRSRLLCPRILGGKGGLSLRTGEKVTSPHSKKQRKSGGGISSLL